MEKIDIDAGEEIRDVNNYYSHVLPPTYLLLTKLLATFREQVDALLPGGYAYAIGITLSILAGSL